MNSKEALKRIIFEAKAEKPIFSMYYQEFLKPIEQDLDILEIFKKNLSIKIESCKYGNEFIKNEYITYNGLDLDITNKEEYNKIKNWILHNDL